MGSLIMGLTTCAHWATLVLCLVLASASGQYHQSMHQDANVDSQPQTSQQNYADPSHVQQHQEILVQPNAQVRIQCKLPQMTSSDYRSFYWNFQRSSTGAIKPYTLCFEGKCLEESSLGVKLDMDRESGVYDLVINNVTYDLNDGVYYCYYKDTTPESRQTMNREYRLTVLIPPQPPQIVATSQTPAREGQEYQMSCLSQGGNPEPNITWFRNDLPLGPGQLAGMRLEWARPNASTSASVLTWLPSIEDHGATYRCQVWNKAMSPMQSFEREMRLHVEYAPRISVGPFQPLKVLQGAPIMLTCQVAANPPVKTVRWFKDGQVISNQFNHTIDEARISDAATYACQADNGIAPPLSAAAAHLSGHSSASGSSFLSLLGLAGSSSDPGTRSSTVEARLDVQVLYGPRVQVRASRAPPLNEGDHLTLNCSVEAWPPAHEFIWTRQDEPGFRRLMSGPSSQLELNSLAASDMGNYTCTAINRLEPSINYGGVPIERQASASAMVLVRHRPGVAEISLGQQGETELGTKTLIQCRARPPGYPEPQFKFWRLGPNQSQRLHLSKLAHGSAYTIYSAKPDDEARYGCVAHNELGASSEAEGELVVNEAPAIIRDSSTRRDQDTRLAGDHPYLITVRATGKPEPRVTWYHRSPIDGRRLELSASELQSRFKIDTVSKPEHQSQTGPNGAGSGRVKYVVTSTLTFRQPLEVDDRGLYSIEFSNGLSRVATEEFQLHISHSPIPAPRDAPLLASAPQQQSSRLKAGFDLGETVNLTCRVSAHPKPDFLWFANSATESDKPIENNSRYRTTLSNPRDDIWESTLTFSQLQEADYGEYLCSTANFDHQAGRVSDSVRIYITLGRKTAPDPPTHLEAVDATPDSVTLAWQPGFDGGFALNNFLVQYAPDDGSGLSLAKRFPASPVDTPFTLASSSGSSNNLLVDSIDQPSASASVVLQHQIPPVGHQAAQHQGYPKLYNCLAMNPCTIGNLAPRQAYVFRLRAKNELDMSEFSDELRAQTRANASQIPRIIDASYDTKNGVLYFRIEPNSDYMLSNLNARIEGRSLSGSTDNNVDNSVQEISASVQQLSGGNADTAGWRALKTVPMSSQSEKGEASLNISAAIEQIRLTLCSRSNESLCGPEYVTSPKTASSSFLQLSFRDQRALSLPMLVMTLFFTLMLAGLATLGHSCCVSRKGKKADNIDGRVDGGAIDNKPSVNGALVNSHGANKSSSHGSTTSTNSTSANGTHSNGLHSMDSLNGATGGLANGATMGVASDHSSDHSRQAKLDSILPPNYSHYADRASILIEQQQQQQHPFLQHHQGSLMMGAHDKLGTPFGMPNSALLSVAASQPSPMLGHHQFTYGQLPEPTSAGGQPMSLDSHHHAPSATMMDGSMMLGVSPLDLADGQQQQQQHQQQQQALAVAAAAVQQQRQQQQQQAQQHLWQSQLDAEYNYTPLAAAYVPAGQSDQVLESPYGTAGLIMSQHSAAYDNTTNSDQFQSYMSAYQPQQYNPQQQEQHYQHQQEIAQKQLYGTLTRNGYASGQQGTNNSNDNASSALQQQQLTNAPDQPSPYNQVGSAATLPPPPMQESDYGTVGGRGGRLIREIIV